MGYGEGYGFEAGAQVVVLLDLRGAVLEAEEVGGWVMCNVMGRGLGFEGLRLEFQCLGLGFGLWRGLRF